MSDLGDLLELIHGAPLRYRTLDADVVERHRGEEKRRRVRLPVSPSRWPDRSVGYLKRAPWWRRRSRSRPPWWWRFERPRASDAPFPELWDPSLLLTNYWLETVGTTDHRGRPAIRVRAADRDSPDDYARLANRGEYELLVDPVLGIILRAERIDGKEGVVWEVIDLEFDRHAWADEAPSAPEATGDMLELMYLAKRNFRTIRATFASTPDGGRLGPNEARVWFRSRWVWRAEEETEHGTQLRIANEHRYWVSPPGGAVEAARTSAEGFRHWYDPPYEEYWDPALLIPGLWFRPEGREPVGDRDAWRSAFASRSTSDYWDPSFFDDLEEGTLHIDRDAGLIRQLSVLLDGGSFTTQLVDFEADPELSDELFEYGGP